MWLFYYFYFERNFAVLHWRNWGVQVVREHPFLPFFEFFFFYFQLRPFFNESNVFTSGIFERSDIRTKMWRVYEVITYIWGSELSILLYHLLSSKDFFLLIYFTGTLGKAYFEAVLIIHRTRYVKNRRQANTLC